MEYADTTRFWIRVGVVHFIFQSLWELCNFLFPFFFFFSFFFLLRLFIIILDFNVIYFSRRQVKQIKLIVEINGGGLRPKERIVGLDS